VLQIGDQPRLFHGELLISRVFWVIKVKRDVVTSYVAHLCQCIIVLFFNTIPEHIDAYFPSILEFKTSVTVRMGRLHLTNRNFNLFFFIVESPTSQV
jgi:hypothetical protein